MRPAKPNEFGITHTSYITDMSAAGPLEYQLEQAGIEYQRTDLPMGTFCGEPANIITYTSPNTGAAVSVLVIPDAGADSWYEEHYHMRGVDHATALSRDWRPIVQEVRNL